MYQRQVFARARPPAGARTAIPINGGLWLPGSTGGASDASGHHSPGRVVGTVTRVAGPFGQAALKFDGASGHVDCGLSGATAFNWTSLVPFARTFWAWIRRPTSSSQGAVFSKGNNATNTGWQFSVTNTGLQTGWVNSTSNANYTTAVALSAEVWHMVAVAWMGGTLPALGPGALQIWVDAASQVITTGAAGSGSQNSTDNFSLLIGKALYVGGTAGAPVAFADLEVDHWGYSRTFLSQADISDLYARPFKHFTRVGAMRRGTNVPVGQSNMPVRAFPRAALMF